MFKKKKRASLIKIVSVAAIVSNLFVIPVYANDVDSLQEQKTKTQIEVTSLKTQLTDLMVQIGDMEQEASDINDKILSGNIALEKAIEKQKQQYKDMSLRVRYMYENQKNSISESFIASEDMGEALKRAEYFQKIYEYDREELKELDKTTKDIKNLNEELERQKLSLEKSQEEAQSKMKELNELIKSKQSVVSNLDEQILSAQKEAAKEVEKREAEAREKALNKSAERSVNIDKIAVEENKEQERITQQEVVSTQEVVNETKVSEPVKRPVQKPVQNQNAGGIVGTAYAMLGVPYVWGGTTPNGFDCSGLVQYCYAQNGIRVPRVTYSQAVVGTSVSLENASPGDIVVYSDHTAIYIGNGKVIHAPYPGRSVEIAPVNMMPIISIRHL